MPEDPWQDPSAILWIKDVAENMAPKMESSAFCISLVPDDRYGDIKFWVELGASVMMNKPIIAVVMTETPVPPKLALVADEIVFCPLGVDPSSTQALVDAIRRVEAKLHLDDEPTWKDEGI